MNDPLVSVVIPAHNAQRYLADAIRSVLEQGYRPLEIVVVDDGSTDATLEVARAFGPPVRCEAIAQSGAGAARNHGVEVSSGEVLAFLDADDLWYPRKLEAQLTAISAPTGPDLVFGLLDEFISPELSREQAARLRSRPGVLPAHLVGAMLVRRETFGRVGPFATHFAIGEFVDWMARAKAMGLRDTTLPEPVLSRRVHEANSTLRSRDSLGELAHVLKASLDRRRLEGVA